MTPSGDDTTARSAPTLETGRLRLRAYRKSDLDAQQAIFGDELIMCQLGTAAHDREETWRRLAASVGMWPLLGFGGWAVTRTADEQLIGWVGLFTAWRAIEPAFGEAPEMGWIFAREVHGQGFAGEACRAVLEWADAHLAPTPIWAIVSPDNAPSFALAARLGFERLADSDYRGEPIGVLKRAARA